MAAFIRFHTQENGSGTKISGALLSAQSVHGPWQAVTNSCGDFFTPPPGLAPGHYDVTITAYGYAPRTIPMDLGDCGEVIIGLDGSIPPVPPTVTRPPLPAFDPDSTDPKTGAPLPVQKTMTSVPLPRPDLAFMRANLWGLTVPDLEAIPGGASGAAQGRMLTYLFNRYKQSSQERGIDLYASYGYTAWWMSWPDARATGQSVQDYVADCKRIQRRGVPYIGHLLRSKDFDGPNPDPNGVNDVIQALLDANAMQYEAPAWEASLFNSPEHYWAMVEHDAALLLPHGVTMGHHLQAGYAHYGPNLATGVESARAFWIPSLNLGVKRLYWQADPTWTAGMMQARATDVSQRAGPGGPWGLPEGFDWDAFELCGVPLFNNGNTGDGRLATEDTADLLNYEILCTPGPRPPSGYGNGCRMPDGQPV